MDPRQAEVREAELEVVFQRLADELLVPAVVFDTALWDATDIDAIPKRVGWVAFKDVMIGDTQAVGQGSMLAQTSLITYCPQRFVAASQGLDRSRYDCYVAAVAEYLRAMATFLRVRPELQQDRDELERITENLVYDRSRDGWMLWLEVCWGAVHGGGGSVVP